MKYKLLTASSINGLEEIVNSHLSETPNAFNQNKWELYGQLVIGKEPAADGYGRETFRYFQAVILKS